ncbi:magnesium transporter CorA family protein [Calidifontibacter terrae]
MRTRVWRDGKLVAQEIDREDLLTAVHDPTALVWLDIADAVPADIEGLIDALDLTPTEVEDAFAAHERPKVTRHGQHLFFTAYQVALTGAPDDIQDSRLATHRISGFVLPTALVTVRSSGFDLAPVLQAWDDNMNLLGAGPRALVHGLLDSVVDGHFDAIQQLDDELESLEDLLFEERRTGHDFLRKVYRLRRELVDLRRVVLPMREVVNGLTRHNEHPGGVLDGWYDDLYDHVLRASEWTESLRDMVTSVFETNLSLQDARLNTVMRQLAAWAAIIAVPTAITGWFGQNIPYWGFGKMFGLWLSLGLIVFGSLGLWRAFKSRGWL